MNTLSSLLGVLDPIKPVAASESILRQPVTAVTGDSRKVAPGSIFVALRGEKVDGRTYIAEAIARGCLAVVVDDQEDRSRVLFPLFAVRDSHEALSRLAAAWHGTLPSGCG
jgi:MurE/MurF fusion protein